MVIMGTTVSEASRCCPNTVHFSRTSSVLSPIEILGEMYRASAHGLNELIATVSPTAESLARRVLLPSRPPGVDRISDCGYLR